MLTASLPCPPAVTLNDDGEEEPNPHHVFWTRQDRLLFGALIGTLSPNLVPLVSHVRNSKSLWDVLHRTYALPSRGHIKQVKDQFHRITKSSLSITDYMQAIKSCADRLAALGKPIEQEDLIDKVLSGLDESYSPVVESVNARDATISFEELHEKLINKELTLSQARVDPLLPATAFAAYTRPQGKFNHPRQGQGILPTPNTTPRQPKPFLGKCQWCREQGHVLAHCPAFNQKFPNTTPPANAITLNHSRPSSKPQANTTNLATSSNTSPWILDSGASHHVTADLNNLSLHAPYDGTDELTMGDGKGLKITHYGSIKFSPSFTLNNVLVVPAISKNIISISQLCLDNNISISFSSSSFIVKDLTTGESRSLPGAH